MATQVTSGLLASALITKLQALVNEFGDKRVVYQHGWADVNVVADANLRSGLLPDEDVIELDMEVL